MSDLSRRLFLAAGSAASMFGAVKSASALDALGPDAQLLEIARQWKQLQPAYEAACIEESRLITLFDANRPERPPGMVVRSGDALGVDFDFRRSRNGMRLKRYTSVGVAELRARPRMIQDFIGTDEQWAAEPLDKSLFVWVPDPVAQARAEEVIAVCDAWEAECEAYERSIGLTEVRRVTNELCERDYQLYKALLAIPAKTLGGLAAQAEAIRFRLDEEDEGFITDAVLKLAQDDGR